MKKTQTNMSVDYYYYYKQNFAPIADDHNSTLTINNGYSLYEIDVLKKQDSLPNSFDTDIGNVRVLKEKSNRFYYKDLKKNTVLSSESIYFRKFTVETNLDIFKWKLTNNKKEILGYNCQEAKINYGGRDYIAYFTTEIPIQNGPYKFHGLPGLILEIKTQDDEMEFSIIALKINLKSNKKIENPYTKKKKIYSKEDFEAMYRKKYDEVTSYQGEGGASFSMSKGKIERIIKE